MAKFNLQDSITRPGMNDMVEQYMWDTVDFYTPSESVGDYGKVVGKSAIADMVEVNGRVAQVSDKLIRTNPDRYSELDRVVHILKGADKGVKEGDFVKYDGNYYEIMHINKGRVIHTFGVKRVD